jgi:hypothetical protein
MPATRRLACVESRDVPAQHPRRPAQTTPPSSVERAKAVARKHAEVARVGLTTTADGRWAVKVWLRTGAHPPLRDVESAAGNDVSIVYDSAPETPPVARPAFPALGE